MNFIKQHRKNLKKLTKKQLIQQVLIGLDMSAHQSLGDSIRYDDLNIEFDLCTKELKITQSALQGAESAIRMYENFSIFQFIRHKYQK